MMGGDLAAMHQIIVLPPGAKTMPQKDVDLTSQFDEWLAALICMPFGLAIADLGITPKVASMQSPQASKAAATSRAEPPWLPKPGTRNHVWGIAARNSTSWAG